MGGSTFDTLVHAKLPTTDFVTVNVGSIGVSSHAWQAGTWPVWSQIIL